MKTVADLVNAIAHDVKVLEDSTLRVLLPSLLRARVELQRDLGQWLESHPDGAERFTAQQYRRAIVSVDAALATIGEMNPALVVHLTGAAKAASVMAAGHISDQLSQFGTMFGGSIRPTKISSAAIMARANREIIPRIRTSAARYVQSVREDMRHQFAIGLAKGENFEQLTNRLRHLGGPRGRVALRGVAGEPGAHVEEIAEGLFARYRYWAERVVRTEVINAYNVEHQAGIAELNDDLIADGQDPLDQKWDATPDFRLCALCSALDGEVRAVGEAFAPGVYHPPRHPCCRCVVVAWHPSWGAAKARMSSAEKKRRESKSVPASSSSIPAKGSVRTIPARELAARGYYEPKGRGVDRVKMDKARRAIAEGQRTPARVLVNERGDLEVEDGRHRIAAAIEADANIRVDFRRGIVGGGDVVFRTK